MPASERVSARAARVAFWRKWGGFEAFYRCRVERPSDAMFGKGRERAFALRNLQTPRGAYIAVRNEATKESLLSEPVAARTRK